MSQPAPIPEPRSQGAARRVARNTLWLSASELAARLFGFVVTAALAQRLGAVGFGQVGFAQAVIGFFLFFTEFGLKALGARTLARDPLQARALAWRLTWLRLLLFLLSSLGLAACWWGLPQSDEEKLLLTIFWLSIIPTVTLLDWAFWALERMAWTSAATLTRALVYGALILAIVGGVEDLLWVGWSNLIAASAATLLLLVAFLCATRVTPAPQTTSAPPSWAGGWSLFRSSLPLAASAALVQVTYQLGTVLLGLWKSDEDVGFYVAGFRLVFVLHGVLYGFTTALFPLLSRHFSEHRDKFRVTLDVGIRVMAVIALPLGLGGVLLAEPLILLIYQDQYAPSVASFRILAAALAFMALGGVSGFALLACDRQRRYLITMILGAVINVTLNSLLIPAHAAQGAAWAALATESAIMVGAWYAIPAAVRGSLLMVLWRPALASTVMAGALVSVLHWPLALLIAFGAAVYFAALAVVGGVRREYWELLRRPQAANLNEPM